MHSPEGPASLVERAYALAKSGTFIGVSDIKVELRRQGYNQYEVRDAFEGAALRRDIRRLCQEAHGIKSRNKSDDSGLEPKP